jgi:hypothetical protein
LAKLKTKAIVTNIEATNRAFFVQKIKKISLSNISKVSPRIVIFKRLVSSKRFWGSEGLSIKYS